MSVCQLEYQRARRALDQFCARRNARTSGGVSRLIYRQHGEELLIGELGELRKSAGGEGFRALVRLSYQDERWRLFWPLQGGDWQPYPHLRQAGSIQAVIEELEQAPLHVHWG